MFADDAQIGDYVTYNTITGQETGIIVKVVRTSDDLIDTPMESAKINFNVSGPAYFINVNGDVKFVAGHPMRVLSRYESD